MADLLFKYRALEPWQYLLDIIVENRLFAAKFEKLNDPMEGMFTYAEDKVSADFIKKMLAETNRVGICSLSHTHNNTVMWSYYADGHRGVVLGFTVDKTHADIEAVSEVTYPSAITFEAYDGSDAQTDALGILSKKHSAWQHEKEVRVFSRTDYVPVELRQVYLGCQMPDSQQALLRHLLGRVNPDVEVISMQRAQLDTGG